MLTRPISLSVAVLLLAPSLDLAVEDVQRQREMHCVVFVIDQREDGELVMSEPECFSDEASADTRALEGHHSWNASPADEQGSGVVMASSSVLGKHYQGANGSGSSISVVGSSCTGGYWNTGSSWANRISSSYNGCHRLRHWDLPNKGGISESTYGSGTTNNLTYMNNRTQSVSYHSS